MPLNKETEPKQKYSGIKGEISSVLTIPNKNT